MSSPIRIAVVDPYPLYRQGVAQTIVRSPDLALTAEGEGVADARRLLSAGGIDILMLDVTIFDGSARGVEELAKNCGECKLIILTALDDMFTVSAALAAGVRGYILKGVSGIELIATIKTVHAGQPFVTPELASRMLVEGVVG